MTDDDHLLENQQFWIVYTEAKESLGCSQYLFIPNDIEVMKPTWMYNLKHFPRPKSLKIERNSSSLEEKVTRDRTRTHNLQRKRNRFHFKIWSIVSRGKSL